MTVKLVGSSSGSVSLQAPASTAGGANRVLTLPDINSTIDTTGRAGNILQVKTNTTQGSTGSIHCTPTETYVDIPDQNVTITPSSASNKILISFHQMGETSTNNHHYVWAVKRAISGGATTTIEAPASGNKTQAMTIMTRSHGSDDESTIDVAHCTNYLDSPNTTSAVTYTVQIQNAESTAYYYYNRNYSSSDTKYREVGLSWITVMEIAA